MCVCVILMSPLPYVGIHSTTGPLPMALPSAWTDMALIPGTSWPPSTILMRPPTPPGFGRRKEEVHGIKNRTRQQASGLPQVYYPQ